MNGFLKTLFISSPFFIKRIFANFEAFRRDYYRRYGDFKGDLDRIDIKSIMESGNGDLQTQLSAKLIKKVTQNIDFYKKLKDNACLEELPVITKKDLISSYERFISDELNRKKCFKGTTSGSTGTPLSYYQDRQSVRTSQLYADKLLQYVGLEEKDIKARISGINIIPYECNRPPFWVYIDKYRQLQCSAYHFSEDKYKLFLDAMKKYGVAFGTGYATAWYFLAEYILRSGEKPPTLKAIVSDSEGITIEQQITVEEAFRCPMYQTYGLSEMGQVAFQCSNHKYHLIPAICYAEILNEDYRTVKNGEEGQIALTSLIAEDTPLIRYATGDIGVLGSEECGCGWKTQYFVSIKGRLDDYVLTNDGRKVGRLSHIIKPAVGVVESQLVQLNTNELIIKVVPGSNFSEVSMKTVLDNARNYLGDMKISWEAVRELERTKGGKIKHVIRAF